MRILSHGRVAVIASLAVAVALTAGCSWFRKDNDAYKLSGEARPLELPPELDRPSTEGAMALPSGTSVMASSANRATQGAASPSGFNVAGAQRDDVFARLGDALAGVSGLTIASKAQLLGSYDVSYGGDNFLVRTSQTSSGVYVSAVDPRGMPDSRANPVAVIAQLKTALGGQ